VGRLNLKGNSSQPFFEKGKYRAATKLDNDILYGEEGGKKETGREEKGQASGRSMVEEPHLPCLKGKERSGQTERH